LSVLTPVKPRGLDPVWLFAPTIFLSAWLLFQVQPMFAKMALPLLGGAPSVWNTALVFFQAVLLLGYLYAFALQRWATPRAQVAIHLGVLALALIALPVAIGPSWQAPAADMPVFWLLGLLTVSVGLPFFAVSANSPLLQAWFAAGAGSGRRDPYTLYAASNLGSMLALLAYPFLLEPGLTLAGQSWLWTAGYAALIAAIGLAARRTLRGGAEAAAPATAADDGAAPDWRRRLAWIALAFVPSGLLVAATTLITTDLIAIPLLWIIPLALYLLSFVVVFARRQVVPAGWIRAAQALLLAGAAFFATWSLPNQAYLVMALVLATLFATALVCHGELVRRRPAARHLTEFYVWMSLGGILGSAFAALLAPLLFDQVIEYAMLLVLAGLLRPTTAKPEPHRPGARFPLAGAVARDMSVPVLGLFAVLGLAPKMGDENGSATAALALALVLLLILGFALISHGRPLRFGLTLVALVLFGQQLGANADDGNVYRVRTFYGTHQVKAEPGGAYVRTDSGAIETLAERTGERFHVLAHGTTYHGAQSLDPARRRERNTYYHADSGVGRFLLALEAAGRAPARVGVVGLGSGELACYRRPGQAWTFFEIDPAVVRMSREQKLFRFLDDCAPAARIVLGDGRLTVAAEPPGALDLLVVDAFSSDAIPIHLITREALAVYRAKLAEGGAILFHISNRYIDLEPVLAALARDAGLAARILVTRAPANEPVPRFRYASTWVVMARDEAALAAATEGFDRARPTAWGAWRRPVEKPGARLWTDDYSNVVSVLKRKQP
jgi:hypothetical protein